MDKTNELHTQERSVQRRAGRIVRALAGAGTNPAVALSIWLAAGLLGYLFTGADSFFSARPVGVAWLTALPGPAAVAGLFGSLLGCIPLGRTGIVYGSLFLLVAGVRMLVSVPGKGRRHLPDSPGLFREPSQIRAALACVVGFVSSGYQLIAIGLSTEALLFSLTMILGCTTLCLLFSAFIDGGVTLGELTGRGERPART
ncbi:MAG: hypothetical protein J6P88_00700, partial [Clostridia bacterium]|nr:hypothetical protein [Clostridia bacterium]